MLRWVMSFVMVFAFSASTVEVLIPDVHDGDVSSGVVQHAQQPNDDAPSAPHDAPARPHHTQHVDHCTHAHVADVAAGVAVIPAPACHEAAPGTGHADLVSVATLPTFRPPIL